MAVNYNLNIIRERIEENLKKIVSEIETLEDEIEKVLNSSPFEYESVRVYYLKLNELTQKKNKILAVLNARTYGKRKTVRPKYELVLKFFVNNQIINYNNVILCGKNENANDQVFNITKSLNWTYYHANIIGGGLIAMKDPEDALGNTLACIYSKYLKKTGYARGTSSKARKIIKGSKKGSFLFLDRQHIAVYGALKFSFYKDTQNKKIYVYFNEPTENIQEDLKEKPRSAFFVQASEQPEIRFKALLDHYNNIKITNLDILNTVVPPLYKLSLST